jgi:hypothetical protein
MTATMTAAATNGFEIPEQTYAQPSGGIRVNQSVPVAGVEPWRLEAIIKVIGFGALPDNWDARDSHAPNLGVIQTAIELLQNIPGYEYPTPRVVPISGGGLHFEWTVGNRELELSVDPKGRIEVLKVENGMPIEESVSFELARYFAWLKAT